MSEDCVSGAPKHQQANVPPRSAPSDPPQPEGSLLALEQPLSWAHDPYAPSLHPPVGFAFPGQQGLIQQVPPLVFDPTALGGFHGAYLGGVVTFVPYQDMLNDPWPMAALPPVNELGVTRLPSVALPAPGALLVEIVVGQIPKNPTMFSSQGFCAAFYEVTGVVLHAARVVWKTGCVFAKVHPAERDHFIRHYHKRMLMDVHGFWWAENEVQREVMREHVDVVFGYCVQKRAMHFKDWGLPTNSVSMEDAH